LVLKQKGNDISAIAIPAFRYNKKISKEEIFLISAAIGAI
jgi:hypothetical protein